MTERAYENARFVEDVVREVALRLDSGPRVTAYEVEDEESDYAYSAGGLVKRGSLLMTRVS